MGLISHPLFLTLWVCLIYLRYKLKNILPDLPPTFAALLHLAPPLGDILVPMVRSTELYAAKHLKLTYPPTPPLTTWNQSTGPHYVTTQTLPCLLDLAEEQTLPRSQRSTKSSPLNPLVILPLAPLSIMANSTQCFKNHSRRAWRRITKNLP